MTCSLLLASCSSNSPDPKQVATVSVTPTASPTTIIASPTSTSPPAVIDISYPNCDTGGPDGTVSIGTAVGPTSTPVPSIDSRNPEVARREVGAYLSAMVPIVNYLKSSSEEFDLNWSTERTAAEQAQLLEFLGTRTAIACSAVALATEIPPEVAGFDALLRGGAEARHAWAAVAVDHLECCGTAINTELESGNHAASATVRELVSSAESLLAQYGSTLAGKRIFTDEALDLEVTVDAGWLVSSQGLSPLLVAPLELNSIGIEGLGPDGWQLGTAVRIRRLRNPQLLDVTEASARFTGLITRQGSIEAVQSTDVDGFSALRHAIATSAPNWNATVTVFVAGDFTYFIESGCPATVTGACASVEAVASSLGVMP